MIVFLRLKKKKEKIVKFEFEERYGNSCGNEEF